MNNELNNKKEVIEARETEFENMNVEINNKKLELETKEKDFENKFLEINNKLTTLEEKEKEYKEKNQELITKYNELNKLQESSDRDSKAKQLQLEEMELKYKNLEKEYNDLKTQYEEISKQNMALIAQNDNNNTLLKDTKSQLDLAEQKIKSQNSEIDEYKIRTSQLVENNSQLESKIKEIEKGKDFLPKSIKENIGENENKTLAINMEALSDLSLEDLKMKIISMREVNDLLYQQLNEADEQKLEIEKKLIKLQAAFNDQLEEEKREIVRLYKNKKFKENRELSFASGEEAKNIVSNIENATDIKDEKDEDFNNLRNKMSLLNNENISLKEVVKDLKKEIIELKNLNSIQNKGYNLLGSNIGITKGDENNEKIIEDLMLECNKWKKEYSLMYNENEVLKKYISKLEKNLGIEEQMNNMRTLIAEKDQVLVNLSYQIKEYQSKIDDIILGKTEEGKDRQIQILLNEVKGIRKRILNIITLNDRITNFDEFMEAIKTIKKLENTNKDKDIEKAFDQLTYLIEIYQQNNDNAYSQFVNEIYGEGKNVNNLINFEEFNNEGKNNYNMNGNNGSNINNDFESNNVNNTDNIYDKIDLDSNNINNQNNNLNKGNIDNINYNENAKGNNSINSNQKIIKNDTSNDEQNNNQINNDDNYFDTKLSKNQKNNENNNINFNTNEEEEKDENNNNFNENNNFNNNEGNDIDNNNMNDENNFNNDFDEINFEEFENYDPIQEQNKDNINEDNDQNNNNGEDDIL